MLYAGKYKYSDAEHRMDEDEQEEFRKRNHHHRIQHVHNRAYELTGTTPEDQLLLLRFKHNLSQTRILNAGEEWWTGWCHPLPTPANQRQDTGSVPEIQVQRC